MHLDNIFYLCYRVSQWFLSVAHALQLEKKWEKKDGRQNNNANFVRPCGTIASGNKSLLLFVREGLELSEICIKTQNVLFQRILCIFKSSITDPCVGKWYHFVVSQKCIGLDDPYSSWGNHLLTEEAIWNDN